MDITSIFSGSDNLWKYLFTLGMLMVVVSILYPLERKQEIQIEINTYNQEIDLLNIKISNLRNKSENFLTESNQTLSLIDSLKAVLISSKKVDKVTLGKKIATIQNDFNIRHDQIKNEREEIKISEIVLKYNRSRIDILDDYVSTFNGYFFGLNILGILAVLVGLWFWFKSTIATEELKLIEISKAKEKST